ncbi:MAG: DUF4912 domain-containing protein [Planctomycetota bacterium]|nr:DUF4912 domain-containing protein [Planctomycetota bacterium]
MSRKKSSAKPVKPPSARVKAEPKKAPPPPKAEVKKAPPPKPAVPVKPPSARLKAIIKPEAPKPAPVKAAPPVLAKVAAPVPRVGTPPRAVTAPPVVAKPVSPPVVAKAVVPAPAPKVVAPSAPALKAEALSGLDEADETPTIKKGSRKKAARAPRLPKASKKAVAKKAVAVAAPAVKPLPAPPPPPPPMEEPQPASYIDRGLPIPDSYGWDRLVALPRDPQWLFAYWELTGGLLDRLRQHRGSGFIQSCAWVLRLHRLDEDLAVDLEIDPSIGNWYLHVGKTGSYQVELALLSPEGEWITLVASQVIRTPGEGPSDVFDEQWRLRPEEEARLHRLLLKDLGFDAEGRPTSAFMGASRIPSSWRLVSSQIGASWSGLGPAGSWAWSFVGASGLPSSPGGSGGIANVGWLVGADGRHEPVLVRPNRSGGPNWHFQAYLPETQGNGFRSSHPDFKVKLPRLVKGAPRPKPSWPPEPAPLAAAPKTKLKPAGV